MTINLSLSLTRSQLRSRTISVKYHSYHPADITKTYIERRAMNILLIMFGVLAISLSLAAAVPVDGQIIEVGGDVLQAAENVSCVIAANLHHKRCILYLCICFNKHNRRPAPVTSRCRRTWSRCHWRVQKDSVWTRTVGAGRFTENLLFNYLNTETGIN